MGLGAARGLGGGCGARPSSSTKRAATSVSVSSAPRCTCVKRGASVWATPRRSACSPPSPAPCSFSRACGGRAGIFSPGAAPQGKCLASFAPQRFFPSWVSTATAPARARTAPAADACCCGGGRVLAAIVGAILVILLIRRRRGPLFLSSTVGTQWLVRPRGTRDLPAPRLRSGRARAQLDRPRWSETCPRRRRRTDTLVFAAPLLSKPGLHPRAHLRRQTPRRQSRSFLDPGGGGGGGRAGGGGGGAGRGKGAERAAQVIGAPRPSGWAARGGALPVARVGVRREAPRAREMKGARERATSTRSDFAMRYQARGAGALDWPWPWRRGAWPSSS